MNRKRKPSGPEPMDGYTWAGMNRSEKHNHVCREFGISDPQVTGVIDALDEEFDIENLKANAYRFIKSAEAFRDGHHGR